MLPFLLKPLSHLTAAESIVRDVLQRLPIPVLSARFSESAEENDDPGSGIVLNINFCSEDHLPPRSTKPASEIDELCCGPWCGLEGYDSA